MSKKLNLLIFAIASIVAIVNISAFVDLFFMMKASFMLGVGLFAALVIFDKELIREFV